ncbi:TnsA endonuclease N-terminal domain-containing protein [Chitinibacteraceae bacterium HSL-7]
MSASSFLPVRRIGMSTRCLTGNIPTLGQYESSLERDFMELVRFDKNIQTYTPQPLTIRYLNGDGRCSRYTPDGLIEYRRDIAPAREMRHILCEVKYRADFKENWRSLVAKFRVAKRYAQEHGWEFRIFTEREIRTPYLTNVRFLTGYLHTPSDPVVALRMLDKVADLRETDPETLMTSLFPNVWERAAALPGLWHLVSNYEIGCDLSESITMRTRIWTKEGGHE